MQKIVPQGGLDSADDAAVRMVGLQGLTAAEQMGETALMRDGGELPVQRPAVADDHPGEVLAEQARGLPIGAGAQAFGRRGVRTRIVDGRPPQPPLRNHPARRRKLSTPRGQGASRQTLQCLFAPYRQIPFIASVVTMNHQPAPLVTVPLA